MSRITTKQRNDLNMYLNSYRTPSGTVPVFRYITLAGTLTSRGLNHDRRALEIEHIFRNSPAITPEFAANAVLWLGRELTAVERARIDPNHSTVYTTWTDTIRPLPQDIRNNLAASMTDVDPEYNALNELVSSGSAAAVDVVLRRLGATGNDSDRESLEVASVLDTENTNAAALQAAQDAVAAQAAGAPIAPLSNILGPLSAVDTSTLNSVATAESLGTTAESSHAASNSKSHSGSESHPSMPSVMSGSSESGSSESSQGDIEQFIDDVLGHYDFTDAEFDIFRDILSSMTSSQRESTYREIRSAIETDDYPAETSVRAFFGRALKGSPIEQFLKESGGLIQKRIYDFLHEDYSDSDSLSTPSPPVSPGPDPKVFASQEEAELYYERLITRLKHEPIGPPPPAYPGSPGTPLSPPPSQVDPVTGEIIIFSPGTTPTQSVPSGSVSSSGVPSGPGGPGVSGPGGPGGPGGPVGVPGAAPGGSAVVSATREVGAAASPPYTGKGAIYHREAITVFFNDADHPLWDEELNANIDKAKYSRKDADDVIKNLIFTQGPKFLVGRPKTNGDIQELKEIIQLWSSVQRSMSRGPRIPSVGISLGALLGSIGGAIPWAPTSGSAVTTGAMATSGPPPSGPIPSVSSGPATIMNLAKAWDNKSYGLGGAGHSHGPSTTAETFKVKEQTKIRMYQEAGPGLNEPFPRGVMVLPVASASEQSSRIDHIC